MNSKLKRLYFIILFPSILGFIFSYWIKAYNLMEAGRADYSDILAPSIFILTVAFAIALPIFYRTLFAYRKRHRKSVSEAELIKFERNLLIIVLVTPYLALASFILEFPRFYTAGAILMGIYAMYYFYPSKKRIALDRRIYRVSRDARSVRAA
jgi:hypothetical protein